jgi:hypothetical protein
MVLNFKNREISRVTRKLIRTPTLIITLKKCQFFMIIMYLHEMEDFLWLQNKMCLRNYKLVEIS